MISAQKKFELGLPSDHARSMIKTDQSKTRTRDRDAFTVNIGKVLNIYKVTYQIRLNSEKWAYSRNTPKTVFSGILGPENSMVMLVWR